MKARQPSPRVPFHDAFTLVEIVVSTTVLILLGVFVAQMMSSATSVTTNGRKHMDADGEARLIFDRMADDFSKMPMRQDLDCIFYKNPASPDGVNDAMFFYSEAPGYASATGNKNTVSLIGYRINPTTLQLERLGEALTWDAATSNDASVSSGNAAPGSVVFFSYVSGTATPVPGSTLDGNWSRTIGTPAARYTDGTDTDYHAIGEQVYRLEISFLLGDGSISTKTVANPGTVTNNLSASGPPLITSGSSQGYSTGSRWYDTLASKGYICTDATAGAAVWAPIGTRDLSAIIVAIAILDDKSRKIVADTSKMVAALPDSVDGIPTAQTWEASSYLIASGLPRAAAGQIRIYQRYFYLNRNGSNSSLSAKFMPVLAGMMTSLRPAVPFQSSSLMLGSSKR